MAVEKFEIGSKYICRQKQPTVYGECSWASSMDRLVGQPMVCEKIGADGYPRADMGYFDGWWFHPDWMDNYYENVPVATFQAGKWYRIRDGQSTGVDRAGEYAAGYYAPFWVGLHDACENRRSRSGPVNAAPPSKSLAAHLTWLREWCEEVPAVPAPLPAQTFTKDVEIKLSPDSPAVRVDIKSLSEFAGPGPIRVPSLKDMNTMLEGIVVKGLGPKEPEVYAIKESGQVVPGFEAVPGKPPSQEQLDALALAVANGKGPFWEPVRTLPEGEVFVKDLVQPTFRPKHKRFCWHDWAGHPTDAAKLLPAWAETFFWHSGTSLSGCGRGPSGKGGSLFLQLRPRRVLPFDGRAARGCVGRDPRCPVLREPPQEQPYLRQVRSDASRCPQASADAGS